MKLTGVTPILNVSDVPARIQWFAALSWRVEFTYNEGGMIQGAALRNQHGPAEFAGICCGEAQIFLCHDGQGSRGGPLPKHLSGNDDTGGVWMSWWLERPAEVDEVHELAMRLGVTVAKPPTDEPWGVRECQIIHPDGHIFRVSAFPHGKD